MAGPEAFGDEAVERLANDFTGRTEKHSLSGAIEQEDALLAVDRDDGVHRRIDDSGQSRLAVVQSRFGLLPPTYRKRVSLFVGTLRPCFPVFRKCLRISAEPL